MRPASPEPLHPATIQFLAEWINTPADEEEGCRRASHAIWLATRGGGDSLQRLLREVRETAP